MICAPSEDSYQPGHLGSSASSLDAQVMLLVLSTFDKNWPTGFRDITVQKCDIFVTQGQVTPVVNDPIWPKFELVRDFMHVLVTCKYKKDRIKSNREKVETPFSPL